MSVPAHYDYSGYDSAFGSNYNALNQLNVSAADWTRARGDGDPRIIHYQVAGPFRQNVMNPVYLDRHSLNRNVNKETYRGERFSGGQWDSTPPCKGGSQGCKGCLFGQGGRNEESNHVQPPPPLVPPKPLPLVPTISPKCQLGGSQGYSWVNFFPCMGSAIEGTFQDAFHWAGLPSGVDKWHYVFATRDRPFYLTGALVTMIVSILIVYGLVQLGRKV